MAEDYKEHVPTYTWQEPQQTFEDAKAANPNPENMTAVLLLNSLETTTHLAAVFQNGEWYIIKMSEENRPDFSLEFAAIQNVYDRFDVVYTEIQERLNRIEDRLNKIDEKIIPPTTIVGAIFDD